MLSLDENKIIRNLGLIESSMAIMHECAMGATQGVFSLSIGGSLDIESYYRAVNQTFNMFEGLRCSIQRYQDKYCFYENSCVDYLLDDPIRTKTEKEWDEIEQLFIAEPIDAGESLWRPKMIYSPDLKKTKILLVMHHALFDMQGACTVVNALIGILMGKASIDGVSYQNSKLASSVDSYLENIQDIGTSNKVENVHAYEFPHNRPCGIGERQTCYHRVSINAGILSELEEYCLSQSISKESIFSAAYISAIREVLRANESITLKTAISMRELVKIEANGHSLGCYLGIAEANLLHGESSLIDLARDIQLQNLEYVVEKCLYKRDFSIDNILAFVKNIVEGKVFSAFAVTNAGKLPIDQSIYASLVDKPCLITNRVIGNYAITLQIMELDDSSVFDFVYVFPLINEADIMDIAGIFNDKLIQIVNLNEDC